MNKPTKENKKSRYYRLPLGMSLAVLVTSLGISAVAISAPSITATQYAGGDKVAIRWRESGAVTDPATCGYKEIFRPGSRHALFARIPGGEYQLAVDLRDTGDRMWFGSIPGLSSSTPVELQIRLMDPLTDSYCETSTQASTMVDTTDVDKQPTFNHLGDVLITEFDVVQARPPFVRYWAEYQFGNWASNFSDGDEQNQKLLNNHTYRSVHGLPLFFDSTNGAPSPDVRGSTPSAADPSQINYTDGLSVFQFCGVDEVTEEWVGSCSDEVPVIVSAGPNAPGANNVPRFSMPAQLNVGDSYDMFEGGQFASVESAGDNATPSSNLRYHTLWVTNSALFEVAPWISTPSGTLRFKFKQGVSGTSRVFVSLSDWDAESPENKGRFLGGPETVDMTADHSPIRTIDISVGNSSVQSSSSGARGGDLVHAPVTDTESETSGGGGSLGLALLGLLGFVSARRR